MPGSRPGARVPTIQRSVYLVDPTVVCTASVRAVR
jgi:hypothetical protein